MATTNVYQLAQNWLKWDRNPKTRSEIEQLVEKKDENELKSRLESRISFGTAGLRGAMKAGFSCMNDLTVTQASQGLCLYVKETLAGSQDKGVVVGYDGRYNSHTFAKLTAATFASKGFKVYLFSKIVPTPFVAFAVPELKASVGVMITASHNPKDDNGYKVYWDNGCQINTPHDKGISKQIDLNLEPWDINVDELINNKSLVIDPLEQISNSYFEKIQKYSVGNTQDSANVPIVYTAMHGVGGDYVVKSFEAFKLPKFVPVLQQINPDPAFPTVTFPNPEEGKGALKLAIETAHQHNSRLILANDPDADRLAVAEKQSDNTWKIFNGNEIGILFADWAWRNKSKLYPGVQDNSEFFMINTAVSSQMLKTIATKEGFHCAETLTGFKWVGNKAKELIDQGKKFLFAYEEAIGFMYGDVSLDKDGVRCAPIFAELATSLYAKGSSCQQHLEDLFKRYGYHISKNRYFFCYDPAKMVNIFNDIRKSGEGGRWPTHCGPFEITRIRDLTIDYDSGFKDGKARLPISSSTQMITFYFSNGGIVTLRGSGTEPKLKYYAEVIGEDKDKVESTLSQLVTEIINNFLRPVHYNLTPPSDD